MDKKAILAFLGGGALVGGLVWMVSRPAPVAPPAPSEVVAEVREVPHEVEGQASAPEAAVRHVSPAKSAGKPGAAKPTPVAPAAPTTPTDRAPEPVVTRSEPAPQPVAVNPAPRPTRYDPEPAPAPVKKRELNKVTISAGTQLSVRLGETISSETHKVGDPFQATLEQPLVVDGFVLAERGARVDGRVAIVDPGGRVKGVAEVHLELTALHTSDGQNIKITTDSFIQQAATSKADDAKKVGIGAGIGAAIGAIAGGGRGAAIGAGAGGAAGAGTVIATRGKAAVLPVETKMTFHLGTAVTVTEKAD